MNGAPAGQIPSVSNLPSDWQPKAPAIDAASFRQALETPGVLIHFYWPLTGIEQAIDDAISQIALDFRPPLRHYACNAADAANQGIREFCHAKAVPFVAMFVFGEARRPLVGAMWVKNAKAEIERRFVERPWAPQRWWRFLRKRDHFFTIPSK